MTQRNYDELARRIEQELLDGSFVLDNPGLEQELQNDAARIVRIFLVDGWNLHRSNVPTMSEIRSYAVLYNRALELL